MNDDLRDLFAAAVPTPPPATGQAEAARQFARRRQRRHAAGAAVLVVAVAVPSILVWKHASGGDPTPAGGVRCAGEVVVTEPFDRPRVPAYQTAHAAAVAWAGPGNMDAVRMDGDHAAELVRADGSLRARMRIEASPDEDNPNVSQWSVDGSEVCDDEGSTEPWLGTSLLGCPGTQFRVLPPAENDRSFPTEPEGLRVEAADQIGASTLTPGARSGDATTLTMRAGHVVIAVREVRVADLWRVDRIAACGAQVPNLEGGGYAGIREKAVVRVTVGHCWIPPVELNGRRWVARQQDDFGWGGGVPDHWFGYGVAVVTDGASPGLSYTDLGGAEIAFVPEGSSEASDTSLGCA